MAHVAGTEGYAEQAARLAAAYEALSFEEVHGEVLPLLPPTPADVLDVGAGSGRDAAALARRGHRVLAVEPVAAFREIGARLHPVPGLSWIDDALPDLPRVGALGRRHGLVLLSAVWMHLAPDARRAAMPVLAGLLAPSGLLVLTLRHGPVPPGRGMHAVGEDETEGLAAEAGLTRALRSVREDRLGRDAVRWTTLAYRAPAGPAA